MWGVCLTCKRFSNYSQWSLETNFVSLWVMPSPFIDHAMSNIHRLILISISASTNGPLFLFVIVSLSHLLVILLESVWDITVRDFTHFCRNLMNVSGLNNFCFMLGTQLKDVPVRLSTARLCQPASLGVPPPTHKLSSVSLDQ